MTHSSRVKIRSAWGFVVSRKHDTSRRLGEKSIKAFAEKQVHITLHEGSVGEVNA